MHKVKKPALIPIVGIRVAEKHTQSLKKKKKLKSTQHKSSIT